MERSTATTVGNSAGAATSDIVVGLKYDGLFRALRSAAAVRTHLDYYRWLQSDIHAFVPHRSLLATWGNFETGELKFDLASSLEGDTTHNLHKVPGLGEAMTRLFRRVRGSGRSWMVLRQLLDEAAAYGLDAQSDFYRKHLNYAEALLVYIMHCERGEHDCMYVFSVAEDGVDFDPVVLDLMMPHVDSALRRIKCVAPCPQTSREAGDVSALSDREQEVLDWVSQGKSNEEIGTILGISRNTVKNHLKRIFAKMGVTARSQAVRVYLERQA
jgi:transcriptional regulator EpsA